MLQKHFDKRKVCLYDGTVTLLDRPTHFDYCKASCIHSSSLISCWFFPPLPDFFSSYASSNLTKLSCGLFSCNLLSWQQLTAWSNVNHWGNVTAVMWTLRSSPTRPSLEAAGSELWRHSRTWAVWDPRYPIPFQECPIVWLLVGRRLPPGT